MSFSTSEFLLVRPGDYVAIKNQDSQNNKDKQSNYWIGQEIQMHGLCFK